MNNFQDLWSNPDVPIVLRSTETSPFGRKVRIAIAHFGLGDRVTLEPANTLDETDSLRMQNPLGKMPCLLIGGEAFFDSNVILEMLDMLAGGGKLVPRSGLARFRALTQSHLADGITDAALLIAYEGRFRNSDTTSERWLCHQRGKIQRGLTVFSQSLPDPKQVNLVTITLATCLGYLDWRRPLEWRSEFPQLVGWLTAFAAAHSFWDATESKIK